MKIISGSSGISLHFDKHKGGDSSINGLARHDERQPGGHHSNQNIDDVRTADNVILKSSDEPLDKRIANTINLNRDGGLKGVRKDAVRYVETTVQLSGAILDQPEDKQEETLIHAYDWLNERFGAENVVSAVVHKDETNMHLHFGFVPITEDTNKKGETKSVLKAKKVISKSNLKAYQDDFLKFIQKKEPRMNFRRGGGVNGLSQSQFEEFSRRQKEKDEEIDKQQDELDKREEELDDREEQLEKNEAKLDSLSSSFDRKMTKLEERENDVNQAIKDGQSDLDRREQKLINDRAEFEREQDAIRSRLLSELTGEKEDWRKAKERAQDEINSKSQDLDLNLSAVAKQRDTLDKQIKGQIKRSKQLDEREAVINRRSDELDKKAENAQTKVERYEALKKQFDEQVRAHHQSVLKAILDADSEEREKIKQESMKKTTDSLIESNNIFNFDGLDTSEQHGPQQ